MGSQETFFKKQREKKKARKKKDKMEKREMKKGSESNGLKIDWSLAPENLTLTKEEEQEKANIKKVNNKNNIK